MARKFLVVDDSKAVRIALTGMLARLGVSDDMVREAEDGDQALEAFNEFRPQVVFMDMEMAQAHGVHAASEILTDHPETRVIVATALDRDDPSVKKLIMEGAFEYLQKPITLENLKHIISRLDLEDSGLGRIQ